jgi:hypothetical protein
VALSRRAALRRRRSMAGRHSIQIAGAVGGLTATTATLLSTQGGPSRSNAPPPSSAGRAATAGQDRPCYHSRAEDAPAAAPLVPCHSECDLLNAGLQ